MMSNESEKPFPQWTAIELIDDPAVPARETFGDVAFAELCASIREVGLLQPIGLKRTGERYEVVYGHRRTAACREVGLTSVLTIVFPEGYTQSEAAKLHENITREDLNPGEEAVWFAQMYEAMPTKDTDELANTLKVSREYLEGRLNLLRGDEYVLAALKDKTIGVGVAEELNMIADVASRRDYLGYAISQGATRATVKRWRKMNEAMRDLNPQQVVSHEQPIEHHHGPTPNPMACLFCSGAHEPHNMVFVQIHSHCITFLNRTVGFNVVGVFADAPALPPAAAPGDTNA